MRQKQMNKHFFKSLRNLEHHLNKNKNLVNPVFFLLHSIILFFFKEPSVLTTRQL